MSDHSKTKKQLIEELAALRARVKSLDNASRRSDASPLPSDALALQELKSVRNNLRKAHQLNDQIISMAAEGIIVYDREFRYIVWNRKMENMTGVPAADVIGKCAFDLFPHLKQQGVDRLLEKALLGETVTSKDMLYRIPITNRTGWVSGTYSPLYDPEKNIIGAIGLIRDITERKLTEDALRKSERLYNSLVETAQDLVWRCDNRGRYVYLNKSWESVFGYALDEMLGKPFTAFMDPETAVRDTETFGRMLREQGFIYGYETVHRKKDGSAVDLVFNARAVLDEAGLVIGTQGTALDITEKKRTDEKLKESESLLIKAQNLAHIGHWKLEPKTNIVTGSDELFRIFGLTREDFTLEAFVEAVDPRDREYVVATIQKSTAKGHRYHIEHRLLCRDGAAKYIEAIGEPILDDEGQTLFMMGTVQDITERKTVENQLQEYALRFKALFDGASDAIFLADPESGAILDVNAQAEKLMGRSRKQLIGLHQMELHPQDDPEFYKNLFRLVVDAEEPRPMAAEILAADGRRVPVEIGVSVIPLMDGKHVVQGVFRDISERRAIEEELLKLRKIESVGVLAGGIAHDFNNHLTAILGNIDFASIVMRDDVREASDALNQAKIAAAEARSLTQQLLTFSRGGAPILRPVDLGSLLSETIRFALSGSKSICELDIPKDLWNAHLDEGQISQAIQNIALNADHAMPGGGVVKASAENFTQSEKPALPLTPGKYVKVTIRDTGPGISKEHLPRIFDPYFTTKEHGHGLGLATAYSIIKRHNGHIMAESEEGAGAAFIFFLPATDEAARKSVPHGVKTALRGIRVLIMDDQEAILFLMKRQFEKNGCLAVTALDGAKAVRLYQSAMESGARFDVVVLDLTIPGGMGGLETLEKLLEIDPGVNAVVASGFSSDPIMADYKKHGFKGVAEKPYSFNGLCETILEILGK